MKILWVNPRPLYPMDTGGRKRTHSMLCEIARQHEVTAIALKPDGEDLHPDEQAAPYAQEKVWVPWREARRGSLGFFAKLLKNFLASPYPYTLEKYKFAPLEKEILRLVREREFDLAVCDFLFPAPNFASIHQSANAPATVLFQHNIEAQIWQRMAGGKRNPLAGIYFRNQARRMADCERRLCELFDGVVTVSPEDSGIARDEYGLDNVLGHVPTGVDADYFAPPEGSESGDGITIGFLGSMDWLPNIEAVRWFAEAIYPSVKQRIKNVRWVVIGRRPPSAIRSLADTDPSIEVTGTVDDVRPHLHRCDLLVVPLLSGGGTRIKIMEALAAGLPTVSTTVGAEGLGLIDGTHLLVADESGDFSNAVVRLAEDAKLRLSLGDSGAKLVRSEHSWARAAEAFMNHCEKLLDQ